MVAKKKPTAKKAVSKAKQTAAPMKVSKKPVTKPVSKRAYSSEDGPVYTQFKNKPVEAIRYLMKVQKGVAKDALYRKEIGYVDIAWGRDDRKTDSGWGLKHILKKHGNEFVEAGLTIAQAIPFVFQIGEIKTVGNITRIKIETSQIRLIVSTKWKGAFQNMLITSFVIKKPRR